MCHTDPLRASLPVANGLALEANLHAAFLAFKVARLAHRTTALAWLPVHEALDLAALPAQLHAFNADLARETRVLIFRDIFF